MNTYISSSFYIKNCFNAVIILIRKINELEDKVSELMIQVNVKDNIINNYYSNISTLRNILIEQYSLKPNHLISSNISEYDVSYNRNLLKKSFIFT